jgi:hypothetical protein
MDFFFYGGQPVYDTLCDVDATSPFPMQEVTPELYGITSSPYTYQNPVFDRPSMPQSAPSSCGSSYSGSYSSSFNFPSEDIALPSYPISEYESSADSPAPQISK